MLLTLENGKPVYGITTGVGALRGIKVDPAEATHFNRLLILSHRVSHGDAVPRAVVRATILYRAQGLSMGGAGGRPAVIEALIDALNSDEIPTVHAIGSVGQADLVPLAEVAEALIARGLVLQTREALALHRGELVLHRMGGARARPIRYDCDQDTGNSLVPSRRKVALTEPKLTTSPF